MNVLRAVGIIWTATVLLMAFVNSANSNSKSKSRQLTNETMKHIYIHTFDTKKAWYPENAFCTKQRTCCANYWLAFCCSQFLFQFSLTNCNLFLCRPFDLFFLFKFLSLSIAKQSVCVFVAFRLSQLLT